METPNGTLMTIGELLADVKFAKSTLYKLTQEDKLPGQRVGRHWWYHRAVVDQWLGDKRTNG